YGNRVATLDDARAGPAYLVQAMRPYVAIGLRPAAEIKRVELAGRQCAAGVRRPDQVALPDETEIAILASCPVGNVVVAVEYDLGRIPRTRLVGRERAVDGIRYIDRLHAASGARRA